jgi:nucleoside-diphosphate-sugar epimerase
MAALDPDSPVLVLGGAGGFGGALAAALIERKRRVKLFARSTARLKERFGRPAEVEFVAGDVQDAGTVARAAAGCGLVVHGVNYPYHQWVPYLQTATQNVIAAAQAAGATLLFPGNIYSLGPAAAAPFDEAAPHRPNTRKGAFRARLEGMLEAATRSGGAQAAIRVVNVRAGDYLGPTARNGLVDRIYGNAARGRPIVNFGRLEVVHERIFLPDLARAALDLLALGDRLAAYEVVNVTPGERLTQGDYYALVARAAGHPGLKVRLMPWALVRLIGLFDPVVREFLELAYLYDTTVLLDGANLKRLLPDFRFTATEEAIRLTLASYRAP